MSVRDLSHLDQASSHAETIQGCLARLGEDPEAAWHELVPLIYERILRLTEYFINKGYRHLEDQAGDVLHNVLIGRLRAAFANENVAPETKAELIGLAVRNIKWELETFSRKHRRDAQHAGIEEAQDSDQQPGNVVVQQTTFEPARLAAWTEFQESIEELKPELRQVVELLFFAGISQQEAAGTLRLPLTTVQSRWRAAKIQLALAGSDFLPD